MRYSKNAFTLIELMVVITIMVILSMMVYAPYQHYQTKQKVRNSAKIVTQTLQQARNLAINGASSGTGNTSIGVLFESGATDIILFAYPYDKVLNYTEKIDKSQYLLENKKLEPGVKISGDDYLLIYEAISGSGIYLKDKTSFSNNKLELNIGFGGASAGNLTKQIDYYTRTYISDVQ